MSGRKKFTLKSGNASNFKNMGSSPVLQQADPTLVAAAKAAAMANVPKAFSAQYNKTAEGVIAAQKGKTEMLTTAAKELPGVAIAAGRKIQKGVGKWKAGRKAVKELDIDPRTESWRKEENKLLRKQAREKGKTQFEKEYKEEHKDRKSIADIREITGATKPTKKSKSDKKGKKQHLSKEERKFLKELRESQKTGEEVVTEEAETEIEE